MKRWPQWKLTEDIHGQFQEQAGIAMAAKCNAAHVRMAREHGATLIDRTPVEALRSVGREVEVVAGGKAYRCKKLIISAGAWSNPAIAHFGMSIPIRVTKEQVTYFAAPKLADCQPSKFPVWIWMDDPCFYGFPVFGEAGPKVGQDAGGLEVDPDTRNFEPDQAALRRVQDFLARYLPSALGPIIYTKTCLYSLTPDRDFVIDRLPDDQNVVVGMGGGHGFKFASLIGKILSELATDGRSAYDRPILKEKNPKTNYMM
jgi:sarcosine oxidase